MTQTITETRPVQPVDTTESTSGRIPLHFTTGAATFLIAIAGYLGVNLSPYMITATQNGLGMSVLTAGWLVTGALLCTAIVGLAVAPACVGKHRLLVARTGLSLALAGFGLAALIPACIVPGLLIGGTGAGGAVAASGAALAAFRNPDRIAGVNGLANRGIITVVLAVIPLMGLVPFNVFGALALFAAIGLVVSAWLPMVPTPATNPATASLEDPDDMLKPPATSAPKAVSSTTVTIAGWVLLIVFALWAISEDSLWAMAGVMGEERAGLTADGLSIALSGATAAGLIGSIAMMFIGKRLGRAVPLVILLVAGGLVKISLGYVTNPTMFIVVFIGWQSIYMVGFIYFTAASAGLDANGRWSGPLSAVYLVGSALTPVTGAALAEMFGWQGFVLFLGICSFILAVPAAIVASVSSRVERDLEGVSA